MIDVLLGLAAFLVLRSLWRSWLARRRQRQFERRWWRQLEEDRARRYLDGHVNCGCETQPWQWPDDRPHPLRHRCIGEEASRKLYEEVMR